MKITGEREMSDSKEVAKVEEKPVDPVTEETVSLRNSERVLSNLESLLGEGLFPGMHCGVIAECQHYVGALKSRVTGRLQEISGEAQKAKAEAKRVRKAKAKK